MRSEKGKSVYAVHAALGLSVSEAMLQGCQPVIVEGTADQYYLSGIKNYLIGKGKITPGRELLFPPTGGVTGVTSVASIIGGKDEQLPFVILDSDTQGEALARKLISGMYQGQVERIIRMRDVVAMESAEVEDLFPAELFAKVVSRYLPRPSGQEEEFDDVVAAGKPLVPQVEAYAIRHGLALETGWKVEVAKGMKARLLAATEGNDPMIGKDDVVARWTNLFERVTSTVRT